MGGRGELRRGEGEWRDEEAGSGVEGGWGREGEGGSGGRE